MERYDKLVITFMIFLLATFVGSQFNKAGSNSEQIQIVETKITDALPLANGGMIILEVKREYKTVIMSLEDFQYLAKKRSTMKKAVKGVVGLFARIATDE